MLLRTPDKRSCSLAAAKNHNISRQLATTAWGAARRSQIDYSEEAFRSHGENSLTIQC